jgi:hypothetical protein
MKRLVICLALVACQRHDVGVLLGPDKETLTIGFRCFRGAYPSTELMFQRAIDANAFRFALIVDVVTVEHGFPGCRGEELMTACAEPGNCVLQTQPERYCVDLDIPANEVPTNDPGAMLRRLGQALREEQPIIATDTPDRPVLVRAVATTDSCAVALSKPFVTANLLGCAYSCPTLLDEVDGNISLSLDVLSQYCETAVGICAAFPDAPQP